MSGTNAKRIKVLLIDGQSVFRDGLAIQLNNEENFSAVAGTADSAPAVELIRRHKPDVLIYDIGEDAPRGFPLLREIRESFGDRLQVIAFSEIRAEAAVREFLGAGGAGYLLKTCLFGEYVEAIQWVIRGEKYVCRKLAGEILSKKTVHKYHPEGQEIYEGYKPQRKVINDNNYSSLTTIIIRTPGVY